MTYSKLFNWLKDPQRTEKIFNARLDAEFDAISNAIPWIYPEDPPYNAVRDGVTDDTVALQAALDAGITLGRAVRLRQGTYLTGNLTLGEGQVVIGESPTLTTIKAKSGTTGTFIMTGASGVLAEKNDIVLAYLSINGNYPTVTTGTTLELYGSRPTLIHVTIINSAGNALYTHYTVNARTYSVLGLYSHITIDKARLSGWVNEGPTDSNAHRVEIIDVSQGGDGLGYGYHAVNASAGKITATDMHIWNRTTGGVVPIPTAAALIAQGGSHFLGCQFECGAVSLIDSSGQNDFEGCAFYAPDGTKALQLDGAYTRVTGLIGGGADALYASYVGIDLNTSGCIIDVHCLDTKSGAIDFTNSGGKNFVRVRGSISSGTPYVGVPAVTDIVDLDIDGSGGAILRQHRAPFTVNSNTALAPTPVTDTAFHAVAADSANARYLSDTFGTAVSGGLYVGRRSRGTKASPSAVNTDDFLSGLTGFGYGSTGYSSAARASIQLAAAETWTDSAQGAYAAFYTTPAGGTSTAETARVASTGIIGPAGAGGVPLQGTNTNNSASSGFVGEYISAITQSTPTTVTITIASPAVISWTSHGLALGSAVRFTTTGALPTGITADTTYWVVPIDANSFSIATTPANAIAGTKINTSGSQSGTQTGRSRVKMATSTTQSWGFIQLTAGDWNVYCFQSLIIAGTTVYTELDVSLSTALDTFDNTSGRFLATSYPAGTTLGTTGTISTQIAGSRFSVGSTTTIFANAFCTFTTSTIDAIGLLYARRMR